MNVFCVLHTRSVSSELINNQTINETWKWCLRGWVWIMISSARADRMFIHKLTPNRHRTRSKASCVKRWVRKIGVVWQTVTRLPGQLYSYGVWLTIAGSMLASHLATSGYGLLMVPEKNKWNSFKAFCWLFSGDLGFDTSRLISSWTA